MLYEYCFPGGESLADIEKRMTAALADIEKQYSGKNVLVVSHEDPIKTVYAAYGLVRDHDVHSLHIGNGMTHIFESKAPKDLHRPYIDKIAFPCSVCGEIMARIPDVFDCWFHCRGIGSDARLVLHASCFGNDFDEKKYWFRQK